MVENAPTPPCECPAADYCERYGREMSEHHHSICRGTATKASGEPMTAEECETYRRNWAMLAAAGGQPRPPKRLGADDLPCEHRGEKTGTETCQLCGQKGKQVSVYRCALHGSCTISKYMSGKSPHAACLYCKDRKEGPSVIAQPNRQPAIIPLDQVPKFTTQEWRRLPQDQKDFWRQQKRLRRAAGVGEFAPQQPPDGSTPFVDFEGRPIHLAHFGQGAACFIVLGGPSLRALDLSQLRRRGVFTLAVNNAATVIRPNAFAYVDPPEKFCDAIWLDPAVLKFVPDRHFSRPLRTRQADGRIVPKVVDGRAVLVKDMPGVIGLRRNARFDPDRYLPEASINWGSDKKNSRRTGQPHVLNSMFCVLKIAYAIGFRAVYLLGCDFQMTADQPYAFDAGKQDSAVASNNGSYLKMNRMFTDLRPRFDAAGFRVFNCNPDSKLTAFDHVPYDRAIEAASSHVPQDPISAAGWYTK